MAYESEQCGWRAIVHPMEVGHQSFIATYSIRLLRDLGIKGQAQCHKKNIRRIRRKEPNWASRRYGSTCGVPVIKTNNIITECKTKQMSEKQRDSGAPSKTRKRRRRVERRMSVANDSPLECLHVPWRDSDLQAKPERYQMVVSEHQWRLQHMLNWQFEPLLCCLCSKSLTCNVRYGPGALALCEPSPPRHSRPLLPTLSPGISLPFRPRLSFVCAAYSDKRGDEEKPGESGCSKNATESKEFMSGGDVMAQDSPHSALTLELHDQVEQSLKQWKKPRSLSPSLFISVFIHYRPLPDAESPTRSQLLRPTWNCDSPDPPAQHMEALPCSMW
ncbi:unnamed protein product [Pleuronectes platessa]|uniref:Uncharacterized protein n=1 Tax=Pleuronectes platessa TaxID=8262 RepID=A0A9N7TRR0_PLEPL|nr:unnamed protein product [Pleuronectes platessa]